MAFLALFVLLQLASRITRKNFIFLSYAVYSTANLELELLQYKNGGTGIGLKAITSERHEESCGFWLVDATIDRWTPS